MTRAGSGEAGSAEEAAEAAEEATAAGSQRPGERPAGCPLGRTAVAKEKNGGGPAAEAGAGSAVAAHRSPPAAVFARARVSPKLPVRARFLCPPASARIPLPDGLEWGLSFPQPGFT